MLSLRSLCAVSVAGLALVPAGCRQDMARQPKLVDNGPAAFFSDGAANRPLVAGTVARNAPAALPLRPEVTPALLARGRERFDINCSPCHGPAGDGDGRIVERGFPRPPSYHIDRLVQADPEHVYDVITNGYGVMYPYGYRIGVADRWAIVAYIRALQVSQSPTLAAAAGANSGTRNADVGSAPAMRTPATYRKPPSGRRAIALIGIGALAIAATVLTDRVAGGGAILVALMPVLGIALGSAVLLTIHALTGGDWGDAFGSDLARTAAAAPGLILAVLAIAFAAHVLYPWANGSSTLTNPEAARIYFAVPFVTARALAVLVAFAFLLWSATRVIGDPLVAALALIAYALAISFASVDWVMSLEPRWSSTAFAALTAIGQIAAALGFIAVTRLEVPPDSVTEDLAQLIIATILGVAYLGFMQFLVIWSGNLPERISYYVTRDTLAWNSVLIGAMLLGVALPLLLLVSRDGRRAPRTVALAGSGVIGGYLLLWLWQIVPALSSASAALIILAFAGVACIGFGGREYVPRLAEHR